MNTNTNHTTANVFPASAGLDVNDMLEVMADRTGEAYAVISLNYWGKGEYSTLVPCNSASDAPRIRLERNMNGFYVLDRNFAYSAKAQALFAGHIGMMEEISQIVADADEMADYEGFVTDIRLAHDAPVPAAPIADLDHDLDFSIFGMEADDEAAIVPVLPAPLALVMPVAPAAPAAPTVIITPLVITGAKGILTATANGWEAESATNPGTFHTTADDGSHCSCPGSRYRGRCWHRTAVMAHNAPDLPAFLREEYQL